MLEKASRHQIKRVEAEYIRTKKMPLLQICMIDSVCAVPMKMGQ